MTFWEMLMIAYADLARTSRRRLAWKRKARAVRQIPRHDGTGRTWSVEDSGPLEELLKLARRDAAAQRAVRPPSVKHVPQHYHVAPVAADWMPPIGARRIAATLEDTGVWNRAELERMLEKVPA